MKNKYQFAHNKPDDKRRKPNRRNILTFEGAASKFLQEITPLLSQFQNEMLEIEKRITDAEKQVGLAEERTLQAVSEIIKIAKEQSGYKRKNNRKSPKVFDDHHKKVLKIITNQRNKGKTFEQIALYLREQNTPTFSGRGTWHAQTVHRIWEDNIK